MNRFAWILTLALTASACGGNAPTSGGAAPDGSADTAASDSSASDTGAADTGAADTGAADTGLPADSSASADVAAADAAADVASSNANCTFNSDCIAAERCECDEVKGCSCKIGPRGTGKSGVDACTDSNDCETALCVEGPPSDGKFYCSGPCSSASDCKGKLPICSNIAFVGKVCIRDPKAP